MEREHPKLMAYTALTFPSSMEMKLNINVEEPFTQTGVLPTG